MHHVHLTLGLSHLSAATFFSGSIAVGSKNQLMTHLRGWLVEHSETGRSQFRVQTVSSEENRRKIRTFVYATSRAPCTTHYPFTAMARKQGSVTLDFLFPRFIEDVHTYVHTYACTTHNRTYPEGQHGQCSVCTLIYQTSKPRSCRFPVRVCRGAPKETTKARSTTSTLKTLFSSSCTHWGPSDERFSARCLPGTSPGSSDPAHVHLLVAARRTT